MARKKYTLPRHTNLAKQGARTGAFFVDLALLVALSLAFVFAIFMPIFRPKMNECNDLIDHERINSGLYYKNENGEVSILPGDSEVSVFVDAMEYYYFHYLPGENIKEGLQPSKEKRVTTVEWFNSTILEIDENSDESYFEYKEVDGVIDKSQIGVLKEGVSNQYAYTFITNKYKSTIVYDFNLLKEIDEAGNAIMLRSTIAYVVSSIVSGALIYILIPFIFKNGQTVGKRIFHLGLANADGYKFSNAKLFMRYMPFFVIDLSFLIILRMNFYIVLTMVLTLFLVSFTLAMASPKRMSLHDFTAQTLVVDLKTSILFSNSGEEEAYILKEDNQEIENIVSENAGEEPELKYEK